MWILPVIIPLPPIDVPSQEVQTLNKIIFIMAKNIHAWSSGPGLIYLFWQMDISIPYLFPFICCSFFCENKNTDLFLQMYIEHRTIFTLFIFVLVPFKKLFPSEHFHNFQIKRKQRSICTIDSMSCTNLSKDRSTILIVRIHAVWDVE